MSGPDKVRQALAMQDAGYDAKFDYRDVAALLNAHDKAIKALRGLVYINESWNERVSKIIERPVGWTDGYLDESRAVLSEADGLR